MGMNRGLLIQQDKPLVYVPMLITSATLPIWSDLPFPAVSLCPHSLHSNDPPEAPRLPHVLWGKRSIPLPHKMM